MRERMNIKMTMSRGLASLQQSGVRIVLVFGALLVVPFVALSSSVSAAYPCPSGAVCVYEHQQGGGERTYWGGTLSGCWNMTPSWNDRISSIQNNTSSF